MKKRISLILIAAVFLSFIACGGQNGVKRTVEGNLKTYTERRDGTWECGGIVYQNRLEIRGRLGGAACDTVYVYLSNLPEITFEQAWKASGLSSNTADYFDPKDAVLVDWRAEESSITDPESLTGADLFRFLKPIHTISGKVFEGGRETPFVIENDFKTPNGGPVYPVTTWLRGLICIPCETPETVYGDRVYSFAVDGTEAFAYDDRGGDIAYLIVDGLYYQVQNPSTPPLG